MRIKAVSSLVGGEVLAEPILTEKNDILIPNGTRIKPDYVPLIESLGIESVMVEDPYENYESPNSIVDPAIFNKYVEKVRRLMESHIYHDGKSLKEFEIIANDIVHDINDMPYDVIVDIKERNSDLYEHTVMVTLLSVLVARKLKLDEKRKYNIAVGCLLHDIGLRFIVTRYKNRDFSNANPAELFKYKKHTILGYSALDEESWIAPISMKMVLSHHENMAGTGFPMNTGILLQLAKGLGISIFIVGHVTKEGTVAGPRVLEHMVDTVLYFEGDRHASYRILRGVKNRFGSTNEIGVFEMRETGLAEVKNPSEYMLNGRPENASGSVVACTMEGTRPLLIELQALVCHSNFGIPRRQTTGTDFNRVNLLMAVLEKRSGVQLSSCDAYVNITGGIKIQEPAIDLGIVLAILSSFRNKALNPKMVAFGEVGLSGEVRAVSMAKQRVAEAEKLGFEECVVPYVSLEECKKESKIRVIGVSSVQDAMDRLF